MQITETECPWCHRGKIVMHTPEEPWVVNEDSGAAYRRGPKGRPARFRTSPIAWFSCTDCGINGTLSYLRMMLTGGVRRYLRDVQIAAKAAGVHAGGSALSRE